ncbi:MAG: glycoside hydrolase family 76 protein [Bacteroidales bacterium]
MKVPFKPSVLLLAGFLALTGFRDKQTSEDLRRAKVTLENIFKHYDAGYDNLLNENYPVKPGETVTYLAGADSVKGTRVAYLWPYSGVFTATVRLLESTGERKYLRLLENKIIPGLGQYFDNSRKPDCYQSYITSAGPSDRYYDDNIWVAIDFCDLYGISHNPDHLDRAVTLWKFIISGWDEKLGGGIYWCEEKKQSKNTCSNAPSSVLALKLFEATRDSDYFKWGLRIYNWTSDNLKDKDDHLYFDNINLAGKTDKRKYAYNSGQMLQASVLLYKLTGDLNYIVEARLIAAASLDHFTTDFITVEGKRIRIFKGNDAWFTAVLMRGYAELYHADSDDRYIGDYIDNLDNVWKHARDENGLFSKDWKGQKQDKYKWLLDQAAFVEMEAGIHLLSRR